MRTITPERQAIRTSSAASPWIMTVMRLRRPTTRPQRPTLTTHPWRWLATTAQATEHTPLVLNGLAAESISEGGSRFETPPSVVARPAVLALRGSELLLLVL